MDQLLPDGLVLRSARPADLDRIAALLTARGEAADALDHRLMVEDPDAGWGNCAVVVDGDRVVSTLTLLAETLYLDGVAVPAGQVELVATDRGYEGRGLVRALMGWAHRRSADLGQLVQVMIGIPYFYRQFGYQYAIRMPHSRPVATVPAMPEGYRVRLAGPADIPVMAALQDAEQSAFDVRMPHSPPCWRALVARAGSNQVLVERDGVPVGTARLTPPGEGQLGEVATTDAAAVRALLAWGHGRSGGALTVAERPGGPAGAALERFLGPGPAQASRYYVRVADPVALLDRLRPVLSGRLSKAGLAGGTGGILLSFYRSHVRLDHRDGAIVGLRPGGTMQAPASAGGAGIAPDQVGALLFGPDGFTGLTQRHPDVYPGPLEAVMHALFPPVSADLLTLYLP